ncbi:MAG: site-specific DNA-methyltransferase [Mucinivorans sp.]
MEQVKSSRNKTLTLEDGENSKLMGRVLVPQKGEYLSADRVINATICADLLDVVDYMPRSFADLIIIDPPYNLSKNFNGLTFGAMKDDDYVVYLRSWFVKVCKLLKPNGSIYICCDWKSTSVIQQVMSENLTILNRITWQREKGKGAAANWKNGMEDIWFGVKNDKNYYFDLQSVKVRRKVIAPYKKDGKPKDWQETEDGNFRMTYLSNFWDDITIPYWSMAENTNHPTQKPEKLIAKLILASCPKDGVVFDPFLGSGTTSVVAKKLGRRYCGIEISEEYCAWCEKRLEQADSSQSIQGYTQGVFWERNSFGLQKAVTKSKNQAVTQNLLF